MKIEINATKREVQGTGASRRLRRAGRVPGIVYGGDKQPVNIELDHKDLLKKDDGYYHDGQRKRQSLHSYYFSWPL